MTFQARFILKLSCALSLITAGPVFASTPEGAKCLRQHLHHLAEEQPSAPHFLSPAVFDELMAKQKAGWKKLPNPVKIRTPAGEFTGQYSIGSATSQVLYDPVHGKIIKFYSSPAYFTQALYEIRVTEFLRAQGISVPPVRASGKIRLTEKTPFTHDDNPADNRKFFRNRIEAGDYVVIVKDYVDGLSQRSLMDAMPGSYEKSPLYAEVKNHADDLIHRYFNGENPAQHFKTWLKEKYPQDYERISQTQVVAAVEQSDIDPSNFLYLRGQGWVLIDP